MFGGFCFSQAHGDLRRCCPRTGTNDSGPVDSRSVGYFKGFTVVNSSTGDSNSS